VGREVLAGIRLYGDGEVAFSPFRDGLLLDCIVRFVDRGGGGVDPIVLVVHMRDFTLRGKCGFDQICRRYSASDTVSAVGIHLGRIQCDAAIEAKLRSKTPSLTSDEVREAVQWPAESRSAWEDHPQHGRRVVAKGELADGTVIMAWLLALPAWDQEADTWNIMTARKLVG